MRDYSRYNINDNRKLANSRGCATTLNMFGMKQIKDFGVYSYRTVINYRVVK